MDDELILCDISEVLRAHNKLVGGISHEEAVRRIRAIVNSSDDAKKETKTNE